MKPRAFFFSPLLRLRAQLVSQFVGFVNPRGPFWMCHISVNCHRHMKQQPPPRCFSARQPPPPSGNDTKCTPVFLSARLLWGCFLNRLWQGDLCYRLRWSLPSRLDKKDILSVNKVERKKKSLLPLSDSVEFSILQRDWKMNSFLGSGRKVNKTA